MRFFATNLIDASGVAISETSEVDTLPSSNVAHEFRGKVWRTGTSVALEAVIFDLGSAQSVTACIILDHTLTAGDSLIKIQGNTADSWGAPAFSQTITYAADIMSVTFSTQTYRYWRFTFTKSGSSEQRDIGRIFLGVYTSPETNDDPSYDGNDFTTQDLSRKQKSLSGQTWTEDLPAYQTIRLDFDHVSNTSKNTIAAYVDEVKESVSHFIQVSTSSPFDEVFYVKLAGPPKFRPVAQDSSPVWSVTLEYEEQL